MGPQCQLGTTTFSSFHPSVDGVGDRQRDPNVSLSATFHAQSQESTTRLSYLFPGQEWSAFWPGMAELSGASPWDLGEMMRESQP